MRDFATKNFIAACRFKAVNEKEAVVGLTTLYSPSIYTATSIISAT